MNFLKIPREIDAEMIAWESFLYPEDQRTVSVFLAIKKTTNKVLIIFLVLFVVFFVVSQNPIWFYLGFLGSWFFVWLSDRYWDKRVSHIIDKAKSFHERKIAVEQLLDRKISELESKLEEKRAS